MVDPFEDKSFDDEDYHESRDADNRVGKPAPLEAQPMTRGQIKRYAHREAAAMLESAIDSGCDVNLDDDSYSNGDHAAVVIARYEIIDKLRKVSEHARQQRADGGTMRKLE